MSHPYANLTPDSVLAAVESTGLFADGRQLALNSYENRVYQVWLEDALPVVAKFYRPERWPDAAILEEHAYTIELAAREVPVVAPLVFNGRTLFEHAGFRFALYPRQGGRVPELSDPATREWLGRFIGRIHAVGALQPFAHRPALDIASFGTEPRDYLLQHDWLPAELREVWAGVSAQALDGVRHAFDRAGEYPAIRLHGDCHMGNVLWTDDGPHFVDFDDSRMGPAIQDLWMLLSGDREEMGLQLGALLEGYQDFCDFDYGQLGLIEPLRTLRIIHYAGWLAQRADDPAFQQAFPWFYGPRYWEEHILSLREQAAALDEPPLSTL
jgi:Ser/Thr protein kinase RdoA (MazF antagonist)